MTAFAAGAAAPPSARPAGATPGSWLAVADAGRAASTGVGVRAGVRPVRVLQVMIAGLVLTNLGRAPILFHGPEWPVLVNDLLVWTALAVCAAACLQARRLRVDPLVAVAGVFACIGTGSAVWAAQKYALSTYELLASLTYLVRWLAFFGLYVAVTNVARDGDADALWGSLQRTALRFAAFGLFQVAAFSHFAQQIYPAGPENMGWDDQGRRLVSTMLDPNFAGIFMLLPLLVYLAQLAYGERMPLWKPLLLLAGVFLTVSRGTILGLVVGLGIVVAVCGVGRRLAKAAGVGLLLAAPALPFFVQFAAGFNKFKIDDSALARVEAWLHALTVIRDNPVFGIGFNTYLYVQRAYGWLHEGRAPAGLDGGLLFITVLTGLAGLLTYVVLLALAVRRCRRLWRDAAAPPRARGFALGTGAGMVVLVLHSITVNSLLMSFIMEVQWLMVAIVAVYARAARRGAAPALGA